MDEIQPVSGRRRVRAGVFAGILVAGVVAAALMLSNAPIATAQTPTPTTPAVPKGEIRMFKGPGPGFMGGGIHGEFVVPKDDGGYQTIASQIGEVTDVSSSSITLKSEDGFTRTYSVGDDTVVTAGNNGIADVAKGDTAHVTAVVTDGKAHATDVFDQTKVGGLKRAGLPGPPPIVESAP